MQPHETAPAALRALKVKQTVLDSNMQQTVVDPYFDFILRIQKIFVQGNPNRLLQPLQFSVATLQTDNRNEDSVSINCYNGKADCGKNTLM